MSYLNNNNLFVSGDGTIGGNLNVSTLYIKNNITTSGTLTVSGITRLKGGGDVIGFDTHFPFTDSSNYISGPTIFRGGNITVTGNANISGNITTSSLLVYSSSLIPFDNALMTVWQAHTTTSNTSVISQIKNSSNGIQEYYWQLTDTGNYQLIQAAYNGVYSYVDRIFFNNSGMIGIRTQSPTQASVVIGNFISSNIGSSGYLDSTGATGTASGAFGASLWATGDIAGTTLRAFSDQRIKKNIIQLNDATCLEQLRQLQPTQYNYIDQLQRGSSTVIGFIAQDVKTIIPYAVTITPDYIPSIFTTATVSDNTLTFDSAIDILNTSLTKLKLFDINNKEIFTNVTSILSDSNLIISDTLQPEKLLDGKIFVYGHEVPDFHQLDKNAIFTVAVGAIQELDRKNSELQSTVTILQTELSELKSILISKGII